MPQRAEKVALFPTASLVADSPFMRLARTIPCVMFGQSGRSDYSRDFVTLDF